MIQPITVYPTDTPGLYHASGCLPAFPISVLPWETLYCCECLRLLNTASDKHWEINGFHYCKNCVVVADEGEGP